ncbi:MAG: hypothetical protein ACREMO_11475 [Gemmatimonadales bacterium]
MTDWAATQRIAANVTLAEGMTIQGDVHVQILAATHDGPETPLEMLNRPDQFFAMTLGSGEVIFVAKAQVSVVACRVEVTRTDPQRASAARHTGLHVMMRGGGELRGFATVELPPTKGRALDYLNAPEPFFSIVTQDFTLFIHRAHVRVARPLS